MEIEKRPTYVPLLTVWAIGATLAAVFFLLRPALVDGKLVQSPDLAINSLIETAEDVSRWPLQSPTSATSSGELSGEVIWSGVRQVGFIRLSGILPNDPGERQFQMWIHDSERDSQPVPGGVFNVHYPSGDKSQEVVIPISPYLPVTEPKAFVVTLEKRGGVLHPSYSDAVGVALAD